MKDFLSKNKVFIVGLLQFVLTTLTELFADPHGLYSAYIIGYSLVVAILTYIGRNVRGQWASISSAVLSSVVVFGALHDQHMPITMAIIVTRIIFPLALAIVGIFYTSPPKSIEYEHSTPIVQAKAQARAMEEAKKQP